MRFINRSRQSGKTTMLIHAAYVTGYPIIVRDSMRANIVLKQAKELGVDISVFTIEEFSRYKLNRSTCNEIFIDEAKDVIEYALEQAFNAPIAAVTFTIPYEDINSKEG